MPQSHSSDFIGQMPIPKLLLRFTTPAIISVSINCLYNIVDRLYIGRGVGTDAMAGLALTFPYMIILMAFGMMVGQGSGAAVSILLGEQKKDDAERVLGQAIAMFLLFVVTFQILGLVFLDKILLLMGGTPKSIPHARSYLSIILWGNLFQHISFGLSNVVRAEGSSNKAMCIILLGAVLNIILDPVFIFIFKMGISGAAIATVISMIASSTWVLCHFYFGSGVLRLHLHNIRIFPKLFLRVIMIGMAPCIMQIVHSTVLIIYNNSLKHFAADEIQATLAIGASGIVNSVFMFLLMPTFGIMQGVQPIIGYNFGAKLFARVRQALKLAVGLATGICVILAVVAYMFAPYMALCFSKDKDSIQMTSHVLRLFAFGFPFIACNMITTNYFLSIGKACVSIILSLTRQVIILIPAILILPRIFGFEGIWWSSPVSDTTSGLIGIVAFFFAIHKLKKVTDLPNPINTPGE